MSVTNKLTKVTFLPSRFPTTSLSRSPVFAGTSHPNCRERSVSACGFLWSLQSQATSWLLSCSRSPALRPRGAASCSTTWGRCRCQCGSACGWQGRTCYWPGYHETQRTGLSPGEHNKYYHFSYNRVEFILPFYSNAKMSLEQSSVCTFKKMS